MQDVKRKKTRNTNRKRKNHANKSKRDVDRRSFDACENKIILKRDSRPNYSC